MDELQEIEEAKRRVSQNQELPVAIAEGGTSIRIHVLYRPQPTKEKVRGPEVRVAPSSERIHQTSRGKKATCKYIGHGNVQFPGPARKPRSVPEQGGFRLLRQRHARGLRDQRRPDDVEVEALQRDQQ